jgi:hypothetical protein
MGVEQETILLIVELRDLATKELAGLQKSLGGVDKGMAAIKKAMGTATDSVVSGTEKLTSKFGEVSKTSATTAKEVQKNLDGWDFSAAIKKLQELDTKIEQTPEPSAHRPGPQPQDKKTKESGALEKTTSGISSLASTALGIGGGLSVLEFAKSSMDAANEWQQSMVKIANASGIPTSQVTALGKQFQDLGSEGPTSAQEFASAFANIAGEMPTITDKSKSAAENVNQLSKAADMLSMATGTDLNTSMKDVADTIKVFHLNTSQANQVATDFYNTARLTGQPVAAISSEFARLQPRLQGSGLDIDHFSGLIKQMSDQMGSGRASIQMVTSAVTALVDAKPGSGAGKELAQLGIALDPTKPQDYQKVMGELQAKFKDFKGTVTGTPAQIEAVNASLKSANQRYSDAATKLADLQEKAKTSGGAMGPLGDQIRAAQAAVDAASGAVDKQQGSLSKLNGTQSEYQDLQAIFGRNAAAMMPIVNGQTQSLDAATKAVTNNGAAVQAQANASQTYAARQKEFQNTLHNLEITVGNELIPIFTQFMGIIQSNMPAIKGAIDDVIGVLRIIGDAVKFVSDHMTIFKPILIAIVGGFVAFKTIKFVAGLFGDMKKGVVDMMDNSKKLLSHLPGLGDAFKKSADDGKKLADAHKQISDAIVGHSSLPAVQQITTALDEMSAAADRAKGASEGLATSQEGVTAASETAAPALESTTVAEDGLNTAMDANPIGAFIAVAMTVATVVVPLIISHWSQIVQFFQGLWDRVKGIFVTVWDFIKEHLGVILGIILTVLMGPFGLFIAFIVTHLTQVKAFFVAAWNDISSFFTTTIPNIINNIVGFFTGLPGAIVSGIGDLGKWIYDNTITPMFNFLKSAIMTYLGLLVDLYIKWPLDIIQALVGFAGKIWGFLYGEFGKIGGDIMGWIGGVAGFFGGIGSSIGHAVVGIAGTIWGFLSGELGQVYNHVSDWITSLIQFFKDLPAKIVNALGNLADQVIKGIGHVIGQIPVVGGALQSLPGIGGLFKADGGAVSAGQGYIVGERGPEFFQPGASGFITPNHMLGGGGSGGGAADVHHHFDLRGAVIADDRSLDALIQKMGYRMATTTLPAAGYRGR